MSKKKKEKKDIEQEEKLHDEAKVAEQPAQPQAEAPEGEEKAEEVADGEPQQDHTEELTRELDKQKKEYHLLYAEFDNYRRRTLQEKQELIKDGGRKALEALLPVVDDIERAIAAIKEGGDMKSLAEGVDLIHDKLISYLARQNVKPIESDGATFDTELHEAVTTFPAPEESLKGKVIDTVERGYTLNDKVLRYAKVVVGQ